MTVVRRSAVERFDFGGLRLPREITKWSRHVGVWVQDNNAPCPFGDLDAALITEVDDSIHEFGFAYAPKSSDGSMGLRCYLKPFGKLPLTVFLSVDGGNHRCGVRLTPIAEVLEGNGSIEALRYGWYRVRTRLRIISADTQMATIGFTNRGMRKYSGSPDRGFYIAHAELDWACR